MSFFGPPDIKKLQAKGNVKDLIKALSYQKDASVPLRAAKALGELGDRQAVEPLIAALKGSDENVQKASALALGEIHDPRAVKPLLDFIEFRKDHFRTSQSERLLIEAALQALVNIGNPAVDPLISYLSSHITTNPEMMAVEALGRIGDSRSVEVIARLLLASKSSYERCKAAWALGEINDPSARESLIKGMKDHDQSVVFEAAEALLNWV